MNFGWFQVIILWMVIAKTTHHEGTSHDPGVLLFCLFLMIVLTVIFKSIFSPKCLDKSTRGRHLVVLKLRGPARLFFFAEVKLFIPKSYLAEIKCSHARWLAAHSGRLSHIGVKECSVGLWWAWVPAGVVCEPGYLWTVRLHRFIQNQLCLDRRKMPRKFPWVPRCF